MAQAVGHLTRKSEVLVLPHTFVSSSADSKGAVVFYWRNCMHEILVNRLGGLGWLVGCFGLHGPLRQYFSLYRTVSQREGERTEK